MREDHLRALYHDVLDYCSEQKIDVYTGLFPFDSLVSVDWNTKLYPDWKMFIDSIAKFRDNNPVIIQCLEYNEAEFRAQLQGLNDEELADFEPLFKSLKPYDGHFHSLSFNLLKGGFCYKYVCLTEWTFELKILLSKIEFAAGGGLSDDFEDEIWDETEIDEMEVETRAAMIVSHDDFYKNGSRDERRMYIIDLLEDQLTPMDVDRIIIAAEKRLDKFIRGKVAELKSQGKTGVQIQSLLNLSRDRYRKYS